MNRILQALMAALFVLSLVYNDAAATEKLLSSEVIVTDVSPSWFVIGMIAFAIALVSVLPLSILLQGGSGAYLADRHEINARVGRSAVGVFWFIVMIICGLLTPEWIIIKWTALLLYRIIARFISWLRYDAFDCVILAIFIPILLFDAFKKYLKENVRVTRRTARTV